MADTVQLPHREVHRVGDAIDRNPPPAAGHARNLGGRLQHGAARVRDPLRRLEALFAQRLTRHHENRAFAPAKRQRDVANRVRRDHGTLGNGQRVGNPAAVAPRRVGGQDEGGDPAGRGHRRLHRGGAVDTDAIRRCAAPHPVRHGPGEPLGVVGERRVVGPVPGRMVADDVHRRGAGAPRVVDVGGAVREPGSAMEQRRGRPSRHARVTIGASGHHCLRKAGHATHAGDLVERRDEMHLRRAGVGEAGIDAAREQRANQAFGSIHDNEAPRALDKLHTLADASRSGRNGP